MRGGGSERQTLHLLRHLDRSTFRPHLYVTSRDGALMDDVPSDVVIHAYSDQQASSGFYYPGRALNQQVAHLREVITDHSIDVIYDRTFHMTLVAGQAAAELGVPRVSTIVSPPDRALPLVEKRFVGLKRRRLARAYRQSKTVVAVSRQASESAERYYGLPPASVEVIANGVDVDRLRQTAGSGHAKPSDRLRLVCVGRMTEEKGHADLIEAIKRLDEAWPETLSPIELTLVGDGPLRESLAQQSQLAAFKKHRVRFIGAVSDAASEIAAGNALVLPSHFEGMPNVVLEAMALEVPVIATRAGGTVELEQDEPTLFWADPANPIQLADAILAFAKDQNASGEETARHVKAASDLISRNHDIRSNVRKIEDLLGKAL